MTMSTIIYLTIKNYYAIIYYYNNRRKKFMVRPQKAVVDNTVYIACVTLILSVAMQSVFLIIGKWELRVLFGNLLGAAAAVTNFFAMAMTVQKAVGKEQKDAKAFMKLSHSLRFICLIIVAVIGCVVKVAFHPVSVVLPLLFPRVGIMLYPVISKKQGGVTDNE